MKHIPEEPFDTQMVPSSSTPQLLNTKTPAVLNAPVFGPNPSHHLTADQRVTALNTVATLSENINLPNMRPIDLFRMESLLVPPVHPHVSLACSKEFHALCLGLCRKCSEVCKCACHHL